MDKKQNKDPIIDLETVKNIYISGQVRGTSFISQIEKDFLQVGVNLKKIIEEVKNTPNHKQGQNEDKS